MGVHNAGKDTLTHHAFHVLKMKGKNCYYISEMAEQALMRGINLGTPAGQMWTLARQMEEEMQAAYWDKREYIICNRTALDHIAYSDKLPIYNQVRAIVTEYVRAFPYHAIFWLRPLPTIQDDGVRDTDRKRQLEVDNNFAKIVPWIEVICPVIQLNAPTKKGRKLQLSREINTWS